MVRYRILSLMVFFVLLFLFIAGRALQLHLMPHKNVESIARRQLSQKIEIVARRGEVRDRYGRELAVSMNSLSIYANPDLVKDPEKAAQHLSELLGESSETIQKKIKEARSRKFIWLERQLNPEQLKRFKDLGLGAFSGLGVIPEYRRVYPQASLAAQTLGFVSVDGKGLAGLESSFDEALRGATHKVVLGRDASGRPLFTKRDQINLDLNSGTDIEVTLDSSIQFSAEKALRNALEKHDAQSGVVIVLEPRTGEILALANAPSFNPNDLAGSSPEARKNRALSDPIEPGSVVKPFVVARALEDKLITANSWISGGGGFIKVGSKTIRESEQRHAVEKMNLADLIRLSSNVGTVVLQQKMGFAKVQDTFLRLGFGSLTGIEMGGESKGIFKIPSEKQNLEQATISFGQGISLTPLQIASSYATLANGGYRVRPRIIHRLINSEGPQAVIENNTKERIFSAETVHTMRKLLEKVVEEDGTGLKARIEGFKVAGKTGTAQKVDYQKGGYKAGAYWSSFVGYVPSEQARYVIYVLIDEPRKGGYYGGVVAAPVFAEVARAALRLGLEQAPKPLAANSKAPLVQNPTKSLKIASTSTKDYSTVPDLSSMPLAMALRTLKAKGNYELRLLGEGKEVVEQSPAPGTKYRPGTTVYLKLR